MPPSTPAPALLPPGAFRVDRKIRFSHTDPAGIVYFPVYFDIFNAVVEDWVTDCLDLDYARILRDRRIGLPTVHAECDFRMPCRMGEMLTLGIVVHRIGRSSIELRINGEIDREVRLSGKLVLVTLSLDDYRAVPIPEDLRGAIERYKVRCHV